MSVQVSVFDREWDWLSEICGQWDFWSETEMKRSLAQSDYCFFWLKDLSGWHGAMLVRDMGSASELLIVYVNSAMRRRGFGETLIAAWLQWAAARGCDKLLLEVASRNTEALRLYRKYSFAETSRRPNYYADGDEAVLMEKHIQGGAKGVD